MHYIISYSFFFFSLRFSDFLSLSLSFLTSFSLSFFLFFFLSFLHLFSHSSPRLCIRDTYTALMYPARDGSVEAHRRFAFRLVHTCTYSAQMYSMYSAHRIGESKRSGGGGCIEHTRGTADRMTACSTLGAGRSVTCRRSGGGGEGNIPHTNNSLAGGGGGVQRLGGYKSRIVALLVQTHAAAEAAHGDSRTHGHAPTCGAWLEWGTAGRQASSRRWRWWRWWRQSAE